MKNRLLWVCSQWCNYKCTYCWQDHARKQIFRGSPGHWADVRSPGEWLCALLHHFKSPVAMHVTGGEVLLDKETGRLFEALLAEGWAITADTNGSFTPTAHNVRVPLMVSYHPEHVTLRQWLTNLKRLMAHNWEIMNGAYVARPGHIEEFRLAKAGLKELNLPINIAPQNFSWDGFTDEERVELSNEIPFEYRSGKSPENEMCAFPSVAYEMDPDGTLFVACHRWPGKIGSIWDSAIPQRFEHSVPCPKVQCACEDKFLFLDDLHVSIGVSAKKTYSEILMCE